MITTVLFDVDDTIIDWKQSAYLCFQRLSDKGGWGLSGEAVYEVFHSTTRPLWEKVEKGEMTGPELRAMRWILVFENLGLVVPGAENFEEVFRKELSFAAIPVEGAGELLRYLSEKYTLAVASNAYFEQQSDRLKLLNFRKYFQHIFTSMEVGFEKPHKEFFEHCLKELGDPEPQNVLMVGDNPLADVGGAKRAGLKACWLNRRSQSTDGVDADYVVTSLKELMDIL